MPTSSQLFALFFLFPTRQNPRQVEEPDVHTYVHGYPETGPDNPEGKSTHAAGCIGTRQWCGRVLFGLPALL